MQYQLFPDLNESEYAELKADIAERGVMVPIEYDELGNLLDGHHRKRICDELGIKDFPSVVRYGMSEKEKRTHVRKLNLARRHLNQEQKRKIVADALKDEPEKSNRQHGRELGVDDKTVSSVRSELESIAEIPQCSEVKTSDGRSYPAKRDTKKTSIWNTTPKQLEQATIPEIAAKISSGQSENLKQAQKEVRREKHKQTLAAAKNPLLGSELVVTDLQDVVQCDALITDPPYGILSEDWEPEQLDEFTREWATHWNECRADFVAVFWSQRHLFSGRELFDECFANYQFQQLLVWHYPNNKSPQSRTMFKQTWEPVFFYRRRDTEKQVKVQAESWGDGLTDFDCHVAAVPQENFNAQDMKQHPAQKPVSVMAWLIASLTKQGDLVCDPFCGSGTTGIAAGQLGRRFHGIELNLDYRQLAEQRIAAFAAKV